MFSKLKYLSNKNSLNILFHFEFSFYNIYAIISKKVSGDCPGIFEILDTIMRR